MSKVSLNLKDSKYLYENVICSLEKLPFSFIYKGKKYNKPIEPIINKTNNSFSMHFIIDDTLKVSYEAKYNEEFGECEYYAYIENISDCVSKKISDLVSLDLSIKGEYAKVISNHGDLVNFYCSYQHNLYNNPLELKQEDGRTCHIVFPYFNLSCGNSGILMAIGWAGTWQANFHENADRIDVLAKTCLNLDCNLLPHEKIRTALIVLLPYSGKNEDDAFNLWREWFIKYNMPKGILPFSTCMLANDTGRKNSDGSASEDYTTWKRSIDKLVREDLVMDYRWIDAGWYLKANNSSSLDDWWGSVGSWNVDTYKWPNGTLKEAVDYCLKYNMKTFLWFEPERVNDIESLIKYHGYQKNWAFETPHLFYNNIGNEDCFNWTLKRIINTLEENDIFMYREDNNAINPSLSFKAIDEYENRIYNIARNGINENKCVLAHYRLLDEIISYQIKHNKANFVDICAGGGGKNDIESLRRGIPIMRSDMDRWTSSMRLSQSFSLPRWIPFHGSSTKETDDSYILLETTGASKYVARAAYLPIYNLNEAFSYNVHLDYDKIRKNYQEWKEINHLLTKDFYHLSPYHRHSTKNSWTVFAYDDRKEKESIVLAFRMEKCLEDTYIIRLSFLDASKEYDIYDVDNKTVKTYKGHILKNIGLKLKINEPKESLLLKIKEK